MLQKGDETSVPNPYNNEDIGIDEEK